jgi:hypothetical protein
VAALCAGPQRSPTRYGRSRSPSWSSSPTAPEVGSHAEHVVGSAAEDWTKLADRMNFIVDLFRTRQNDPNLFKPPYTDWQRDMTLSGRVPAAPL